MTGNLEAEPTPNMNNDGVIININWLLSDDQDALLQDEAGNKIIAAG